MTKTKTTCEYANVGVGARCSGPLLQTMASSASYGAAVYLRPGEWNSAADLDGAASPESKPSLTFARCREHCSNSGSCLGFLVAAGPVVHPPDDGPPLVKVRCRISSEIPTGAAATPPPSKERAGRNSRRAASPAPRRRRHSCHRRGRCVAAAAAATGSKGSSPSSWRSCA